MMFEKRVQKFHTDERHYPDLGSAFDWSCRVGNLIQPIKSTTQIWVVTRHRIEFLGSFLGRHLAGKPVVASPNVGCFLRLSLEFRLIKLINKNTAT